MIARRLAERHHEYMNPELLDSQLATLETPDDAFRIVNDRPPDEDRRQHCGALPLEVATQIAEKRGSNRWDTRCLI